MKDSFPSDPGQINPDKRSHSATRTVYHIEPVERPGGGPVYRLVKRAADFLLAFLALLVCLIPMLIIAVWIRLDSPGPALYRQVRLGLLGKPFTILKFRSMCMDAERNGAQWADENDPRVTRVGKFLRKTRMDELPQFLNILAGQMSFVGPRPERECFYKEFETYIHGFSNRMVVKPGLTGLAQVKGGYELKPEEKIRYDMEYIQHQSLLLDLKCILMTLGVVVDHKGAR